LSNFSSISQITNVLTEIFFEDAYARAAELDAEFKKTGKPTGPLHGLPVSLKDDQDLIGKRTTWGLIAWADQVSDFDSATVTILKKAGAVLYVKVKSNFTTYRRMIETDSVWNPLSLRQTSLKIS
jgi:Asp-tRNA(Asn)/Glu-tRNA(Gln) amidotransferase A subunit family amidase